MGRKAMDIIMGISIIRGAICSGKSKMCLSDIEKIHNENPSLRCIMIVPDHYSYETEKMFVEKFGGIGLNNIEVLTLRRMAINMLSYGELNHLTGSGKQMLIYKAVSSACDELSVRDEKDMKLVTSMRQRGFLDVAASLISEMKRYLVTPEGLRENAEIINDNKTLKNKLTALALVYEKYIKYVEESGCSDSDDDLYRLAGRIEQGNEFDSDTYIWVNRFDKFMPQQLCVIEALLKKGVNMTVSVCCPDAEDESEKLLYTQTEKTLNKIRELADVYGFEGERSAGEGLSHIKDKPDLYKLFRYWTEDFEYKDIPRNIALFQSRDSYGEIERIACKITDLVREEGYRYRDIAILCGDEEEYRHLIEAVFGEYEIPYFTDRKIILSDHPIAMQILSLFSLIEDDWSYDSVFRYLRSGFIYRKEQKGNYTFYSPLNQEDIDSLENFVLKCGIRGAKRWTQEEKWLRENDIVNAAFGEEGENEAEEIIDSLRKEIALPVSKFAEKVKGRKTAMEFATALFEYLKDIHLYEGLKTDISSFRKRDMINEAEQFTKIWNLILDVLNQTTSALSEDKIKIEDFAAYMNVGLSKCEIRTIPSGIDQVYVGSVERSSHANVKAMFIAGAKSGTFPTVIKTEGFLSNKDRGTLSDRYGIKLAPDTKKKMDEQYFKVYRALCAVSEKLYLSYSIQDEEGSPLLPSGMLNDIFRKFPNMRVYDNLLNDANNDRVYISSPKATIHRMLISLSDRYDGRKNPLWDIVREWYEESPERRSVLSLMDKADYYNRRGVMLDSDIANMLYDGKIVYSASRINTFASCPFEYFLKYGLGAKERDEWDVTPANMGSYAHRVINDFCVAVEDGAETNAEKIRAWRSLNDEKRNGILQKIIDETCENMLSSQVRDKERTAGIFRRMGKTISEAATLVQRSLSAGDFAENGMECNFEIDLSENVALRGLIDRIDVCETSDGKRYMRIIDYKTGTTKFDVVNISNGYDMQMVIYALAAAQLMKENGFDTDVTGIYYTGVRSKYRELTKTVTEDNVREKNIREMCLDGVTFAGDGEEETAKVLHSMDNGFFENGESEYAKIKTDKDGNIKGVRSSDEINGVMAHVTETILDMDSRAREGDISLNPYDSGKGSSACAYCSYESVCKFDESRRIPRDRRGSADEIWEIMKTKGAALRGVKNDADMD
ncbi:MAG: exodeoxyribonuclease V subunit gamma [Oscillospiraceae bacterium]|nr:exodeoxyribonuclease V subunit gamma [Oscillospiraceae bacterium]